MQNQRPGEQGWGLAVATRQLLDTADPAEAGRRNPQVDRAITAFLAQPAGSPVEMDDALSDQALILAHHFRVHESYFTDRGVADRITAERRRGIWSGDASSGAAGEARTAAGEGRTAAGAIGVSADRSRTATAGGPAGGEAGVATPVGARGSRRLAGVAVVSAAVLAGAALGGAVGYRMGTGAGRAQALAAAPAPAAAPAAGSGEHHGPEGDALQQIARRVQPAVVQLRVHTGNETATGTAIVLSPDGLLLTDDHVLAAARGSQITAQFENGTSRPAHVVGHDSASNIAVVAAENLAGLAPIRLGNSDTVRVGEQVVAVGAPPVTGGTATRGVVSAVNRPVVVGHDEVSKAPEVLNAIQVDAALKPGDSGGPLVDARGFVVGITTAVPGTALPAGATARQSFAIPINQAERIAERIIDTSHAAQTILGAQVATGPATASPAAAANPNAPADPAGASPAAVAPAVPARSAAPNNPLGAKIVAVAPGSPAADAGLRPGDVVVKFNGRAVTAGEELVAMTKALAPGDTVALVLGNGRAVHVVLARRPVAVSR
jgi:putative serine protease PepD